MAEKDDKKDASGSKDASKQGPKKRPGRGKPRGWRQDLGRRPREHEVAEDESVDAADDNDRADAWVNDNANAWGNAEGSEQLEISISQHF